jgi:hypothetical protein
MSSGIGTLNEKSVHAFLKNRFEPNADSQEIRVGGFIADIVGENGIIEIQTGAFSRLQKKLKAFLSVGHVTVVYPVVTAKKIQNVETGKISGSPKKCTKWHFLSETYSIRDFLKNDNLSFVLVFLTVIETRSGVGKKAVKLGKAPDKILEEKRLDGIKDFSYFTDDLPSPFTQKIFSDTAKLYGLDAWRALHALVAADLVKETFKKGNTKYYEVC